MGATSGLKRDRGICKPTGKPDPKWPDWYARYLVNEPEGQVKGEGEVGGT